MTEAWENRMTPERVIRLGARGYGKSSLTNRLVAEYQRRLAESAPEPPNREAEFARALSGLVPTDYARELLAERHRLAVDAAVTAVLDSLAAELASTGVMVDAGGAPRDVSDAYRFAADLVRARIPVPF